MINATTYKNCTPQDGLRLREYKLVTSRDSKLKAELFFYIKAT